MMSGKEATLLIRIKQAGEGILGQITDKFGSLRNVATAAFVAIGAAIVNSLHQYDQQEKAIESLNTSMVAAGIYTKELSAEYVNQAVALSKLTNFNDEDIISAQAKIQSLIGNVKVTKELTQATLDLATRTGSLDSAAMMIGKTIGTNTNMLSRQGIEIDASADKHKKLELVIAGVSSQLEGQAAAQVKGLGVWSLVSKAVGELSEDLGGKLAPIFIVIGQSMLTLVDKYGPPLINFFGEHLRKTIAEVTYAFTGLQFVFESVGTVIGTTLGYVYEVLAATVKGNFSQIKSLTADYTKSITEDQVKLTEDANKKLSDISAAWSDDQSAKNRESEAKEREAKKKAAELDAQAKLDQQVLDEEALLLKQQNELAMIGASDSQKLAQQIKTLDEQIKNETDATKKISLMKQKSALVDQQIEDAKNAALIKDREDTGRTIATLQSSNNKVLAAAGKAAAITQIAIDTPAAISKALAAFPPPFNFVAAGLVGAAMGAQAARVAGIPLAEGGIVRATPGGIQATIGEGGRDEAVIPLENGQIPGSGGGTTINFNGPVLGNESQAMEFARAIDRNLLKLRQTNQSVAFDTDVI